MLSSLGAVAVALVARSVCGCSPHWERLWMLSLLGVVLGALADGIDRMWLSLVVVVGGFRW